MTKIDHLLVASGLSAKKVAHALAHGKVLSSGRRRLQLIGPDVDNTLVNRSTNAVAKKISFAMRTIEIISTGLKFMLQSYKYNSLSTLTAPVMNIHLSTRS